MTTRLRIAFAGTPEFALPALDALAASPHQLVGVWTQPDRPAGRGRKLSASPVKQRALQLGLTVHQPVTLRDADARAAIQRTAPDVMIVVAYGLILPRSVLDIPRYGCLNIHASLLPRWRGAAPIQRAILAGDTETGVTIMQMDAGLDTGDMLAVRRTPIKADDSAQTLHDRLAALGAEAIVAVLADLDRLHPVAQDSTQVTYANKLSRDEALLDWNRPAVDLARCVRAYNPWPVAYTHWNGELLRVWSAHALSTSSGKHTPGFVIGGSHDGLDVATGDGVLRITRLQLAGKQAMSAADFSRGRALADVRFG
ncbi:MAG TPA: methionyl-tRNA formyltransferase [Gammaproteobacteria bacterium]|nr:methionyl-tRNA formyltransferase [Gammaproteobacteria bacterium]